MAYAIEKQITKVNKGTAGTNTPEWIIFHFVGAAGQAKGNANYFENVYRGASAHFFVDPNRIIQVVPDTTPAWHIGDGSRTKKGGYNGYVGYGATNTNAIGIELCQDTSTGRNVWEWDFHPETLNKAEWLIKQLQAKYNIPDSRVIRHFDASGKLCPGNWQYNNWAKWWAFKKRLSGANVSSKAVANAVADGKYDVSGMYTIKTGDTLSKIAKDHKVTVNQLVQWNDLESADLIFPETKIFVKKPTVKAVDSIDKMAQDVIDGKYGSGETRRAKLGSNYNAVQARVNQILLGTSATTRKTTSQLAQEVLDGKHGSGDQRKASLGSRYNEVQAEVNRLLGATGGKSVNTLAQEVIDGKWGNGTERKNRLINAGYNYVAVQARVNQLI